jgi:hypothetical protein
MRTSKEFRKIVNRLRKKYGKKNGVIKSQFLDHPEYELMGAKNKHAYTRKNQSTESES